MTSLMHSHIGDVRVFIQGAMTGTWYESGNVIPNGDGVVDPGASSTSRIDFPEP